LESSESYDLIETNPQINDVSDGKLKAMFLESKMAEISKQN
jgi:hypothetical protein